MSEHPGRPVVYGALTIPDDMGVRVVTQNRESDQAVAVVAESMDELEAGLQYVEAKLLGLLDDIAKQRAEASDDSA